jgi:hypothetical protein
MLRFSPMMIGGGETDRGVWRSYFFLDESGLKVVEPAEKLAETEVEASEIVSVADWTETTSTNLKLHMPEPTGSVVVFRQLKH